MTKVTGWLRGAVAAAALLMAAVCGVRADTLTLKDGRVLEGTVVRETDGIVWFKYKVGGVETTDPFESGKIAGIEKGEHKAPEAKGDGKTETKAETKDAKTVTAAATPASTTAKPAESKTGVPRIAVITLGEGHEKDMVGIFITADALKRAIPLLEEERVTDVVFRVNSGGGALLEIQKLSDVIQNEYKKRFRVVAWIESAISAAAMTSHCIEEIYFMEHGNYGACTGWFGALQAVEGRELQEVLYMMEKISARGKHDPQIMRAMQIMEPLSCTINEQTGEVSWYQNLDGDYVVNPKERILCFNSQDALKYKFSKGTADDINSLAKLMGYSEYELVGKTIPGVPYPVCRAEQLEREFRETTFKDQSLTRSYFIEYQGAVGMARGAPPEDRGKFVGKARQALEKIKRMVKNNPNFALFVFNMTPEKFKRWVDEQEDLLRELMKK
jgi:hypothetical protein